MKRNNIKYQVSLNFKIDDENKRKIMFNQKLAQIINLEINNQHNYFDNTK